MSPAPDVLIVGAGIVGAACAYELSRYGAHVEVIEQGTAGGGATSAGMGHLVVLDDNPAELALSKLSLELWRALAGSLPTTAEWSDCGTVWVAADEQELQSARAKLDVYRQHDLSAEVLDAKALYEIEPHLRPGLAGGLLVRSDAAVYAPVAAHWLLEQSRCRRTHDSVASIGERGSLTMADGTVRGAGAVVCAAGAASYRLLPQLPVRPRKGHLAITDRYPGLSRHQLVELGYLQSAHGESNQSVAFNVQPRSTGQLLIGSSRQYGEEGSEVDAEILQLMLRRAFHYLPSLANCNVLRVWTGFRAATPDKLPLIGPVREGVYAATGHEGLGVTTSLATAQLLTAQICRRQPPIPLAPYLPERFHA